jgi:putative SOS response-associated peptidase YedK
MCGRLGGAAEKDPHFRQWLNEHYGIRSIRLGTQRYNIPPSAQIPMIVAGSDGYQLHHPRWGLIPRWAKNPKLAPINARADGIATKPMFREAFKRRRGVVIADSFYEWQRSGPSKVPYRFLRADATPLILAAIWDLWKPAPDEEPIESCAIVTTDANEVMAPVHDRMPVILTPEQSHQWLDPDTPATALQRLMVPAPEDDLTHYEVSTYVNSPANDDDRCWLPVDSSAV